MKIRISPGAVLLLLTLLHQDLLFPATLLAAAIHECGHLLAARILHIPLRLLEFDIMGARLFPAYALPSYRAEALLAAAGPACSILLALPLFPLKSAFFAALCSASLSFAVFNLLPISSFDGGRILFALLAHRHSEAAATRILAVSSYISLLLLFALSACLLLRYGENAALAVISASLFARLFLPCVPHGRAFGKKVRIWENLRE